MLVKTPQLVDDLIMSKVRRQNGPAVIDPSKIIASHGAEQASNQLAVETAGNALAESKRRFDTAMKMDRENLDWQKGQSNLANIIGGVNVGVSTIGSIAERKRAQERIDATNAMIGDLDAMDNEQGAYLSKFLTLLNSYRQ